ncbi:tetratricopeptide repeat protein [Kiritimatiellaeota bacterium B1221]|nr:tetratricopeptide repeat protein [Kiritimatiellaeota bacterium B1221]
MQWSSHTILFSDVLPLIRSSGTTILRSTLCCLMTLGALSAQAQEEAAGEQAVRQKDPFDYEAEFIGSLLDQGLFEYASLAVEEARSAFPSLSDRIQVVEVGTLLRQGKTAEVETILEGKKLATDMKGQAMLLQLAMTYDAMGNNDSAMERYQQFLKLNENKTIEDPDVLRYFASAAMRLSVILKDEGKFEEAAKVLDLVIKTSDDNYLKRKFQLMAAQNRLDQALTQSGKAKTTSIAASEKYANELLWGGNDNYFYMAMGMKAWLEFLQDKPEDAVATLNQSKKRAIAVEKSLEESAAPKSEYPRAIMRYVEGMIQWDLAKKALQNGDVEGSKKLAKKSAGNLYNTFLRYEGNEYADRGGLAFEDLKVWVKENFGTDLTQKDPPQRVLELMFKRQLDLAAKLYREEEVDSAEEKLLEGLETYPNTKYTLSALDTLSKIWISKNLDWELMALTSQVAARFPDDENGSRIMLRVGKKMADDENLEGFEFVLRDFGRTFPSHPSAPGMLFKVGSAAADRGNQGTAMEVYNEILELYPESNYAIRVLQLRAEEALKSDNYEEAIKAFVQVRDRSRDPLQSAYAKLRIADSKLSSKDPELEKEALPELIDLRAELEAPGSVFGDDKNKKQTQEFLQNVRYRIGQLLLRQASREKSDELRVQAATELNTYLSEYPDTPQAPDVMYNLGRLYLQQGEFDQATRTFEALASKYSESEAGKDALYSLVKAALEEDQVDVAQAAVQKMVAQPEAYEIEKIYKVAQLMLENERWEEARDSYQLVLASDRTKDNDAMRQRALNGMGNAAMGAGDLDQAAEAFQTLITDYPTSSLVMEAGVSLSELYLMKEPKDPVKAREALSAVSRILVSLPGSSDKAKIGKANLDIALGHIYLAQDEAGKALATWYAVGFTEAKSPELGALVREAIILALDVAQEQVREGNDNRWNLVAELTEQYIKNFPIDKVADEMRSLNLKAIAMAPKEN